MPKDKLKEKMGGWVEDFTDSKLKLLGLTEVLGSFGLILPMAVNILPVLTPAASIFCDNWQVLFSSGNLTNKELTR